VVEALKAQGLTFLEGRSTMNLVAPEAAIYAKARALLDWNARNPFCAGCGQPTMSINAGMRRICPATDFAGLKNAQDSDVAQKPTDRASCATRKGVSNLSFPRTDPTVIMVVVSHDGKRVLL
jgi:NAD+ diphosphatase